MAEYKWHLGFIYCNDRRLINHRPLLKVILNPFFRPLGFCIGSKINYEDMSVSYIFMKCDKVSLRDGLSEMKYKLDEGHYVVKKNTIF